MSTAPRWFAARRLACIAVAVSLAPGVSTRVVAQPAPPRRALPKASAELSQPFTTITNVRELADGRVLVTDPRERVLQLVSANLASAQQVGRTGAGPGEYGLPGRLIAVGADSTWLLDAGNRRVLTLLPDGKFRSQLGAVGGTTGWDPSTTFPRYVDARGYAYFVGSNLIQRNGAIVSADSAPIVRVNRRTGARDTAAFVQLAKTVISTKTSKGQITSMNITINPWAAEDDWVVLPDGRLGIVRVDGYRMDWIAPTGPRRVGARVAYTPVPMTQGDRDAASQRASGAASAPSGTRGGTSLSVGASATPPNFDNWPKIKPPFLARAAILAPNGRVWVLRTRNAADSVPMYDVFDDTGALIEQVALAASSRVVGFGLRSVYVARRDSDDLEYLQRIPLR